MHVGWVMTTSFLTMTSCMLMAGRLRDVLGYTRQRS